MCAKWSDSEKDYLKARVALGIGRKEPLNKVLDEVADKLGRNRLSVSDYYYSNVRKKGTLNIRYSSCEEERQLMTQMLTFRAQGDSLIQAARKIAGQDEALAQRYREKHYRMLTTKPEAVAEIVSDLEKQGIIIPESLLKTRHRSKSPQKKGVDKSEQDE